MLLLLLLLLMVLLLLAGRRGEISSRVSFEYLWAPSSSNSLELDSRTCYRWEGGEVVDSLLLLLLLLLLFRSKFSFFFVRLPRLLFRAMADVTTDRRGTVAPPPLPSLFLFVFIIAFRGPYRVSLFPSVYRVSSSGRPCHAAAAAQGRVVG